MTQYNRQVREAARALEAAIDDYTHRHEPVTPQARQPQQANANDQQVGGEHYRNKAIQPWDAMAAWMTPTEFKGFLRGNAIKYLARAPDKGGIEDYRKAAHYLDKLIDLS